MILFLKKSSIATLKWIYNFKKYKTEKTLLETGSKITVYVMRVMFKCLNVHRQKKKFMMIKAWLEDCREAQRCIVKIYFFNHCDAIISNNNCHVFFLEDENIN